MSSNINLVDKLNPISFEKNNNLKIKINPNDFEHISKKIEDYRTRLNKNSNNSTISKDVKITKSSNETELNLIKLENLYERLLSELDKVENIRKKSTENNEIDVNNNVDKLKNISSMKKKLLLTSLLKPLLNPLFNLF
ncbi:hypothetical protein IX46_03025 [Buchnera aphidicola (Aphis glycines)]|uniref:Uncharacterized protein n=1 Tax=Buchnera aphidicola (Aphis glycines) TaxID=1265350 RepID=A0A0M4H4Y6_9GAMM|nr:hypothetical protein [Buchnera aphidicola]ALD15505.1 hypothetical protein IX46_03025 [Buchnera aphidicola (Aphis glycines)]